MMRPPRLLLLAPILAAGLVLVGALPLTLAACDTGGCEGGELQIEDLSDATAGAEATAGSTVTVAYTGRLEDGTVFDESESVTFDLSNTIAGFREGVVGMHVGEERRITIPPDLAYGEAGNGPVPPCATLTFDVTLLGVQ